jgi:hypothetical protein
MCLGVPRARDLVPPLGTILPWGEGIPHSCLLLPLPPVARVMGKIFKSAQIVTTLTGVTLTSLLLFYNLVYLTIFQLLRAFSSIRFY